MAFWKRKKPPAPAPPPPVPSYAPSYAPSPYMMSPVTLHTWLHTTFGYEPPVRDATWAWWIDAGAEVYLIIKTDRSVWRLPPDKTTQLLSNATDEADFRTIWRRTKRTEPMPNYWIPH